MDFLKWEVEVAPSSKLPFFDRQAERHILRDTEKKFTSTSFRLRGNEKFRRDGDAKKLSSLALKSLVRSHISGHLKGPLVSNRASDGDGLIH